MSLLNCAVSRFSEVQYLRYKLTYQRLKPKRKLVVCVHLIEQWCYEVDPFAYKSEFCVI